MIRSMLTLLLAAHTLGAQAPDLSTLYKPRALSHRPVLEVDKLPALPQSQGRPAATVRPNQDWLDALDKARRKGRFPATVILDSQDKLQGSVPAPGWKAYLMLVPSRSKVVITLQHPDADQFRLDGLSGYADPLMGTYLTNGPGRVPTLEYRNLLDETQILAVAVQDPGRLSGTTPFSLSIKRSWTPGEGTPKRPKDPITWVPEAQ